MSLSPNANFAAWNLFISLEIEKFLTAFQHIEINITLPDTALPTIVPVHAPYMMQRVALIDQPKEFGYLKQRHQARLLRVKAAREQAPEPVKQFLQRHFFDENGREKLLAAGRAELAEVQALLQEAVNQQLISVPKGEKGLNGRILRLWLKTYGIGVDCSSFVQQSLNQLLKKARLAGGQDGGQKNIRFLRSFQAYKEIKNGEMNREPLFTPVPNPAAARPGDVLVKYGHIRIVARIENRPYGRLILQLAESTSAPDIPVGQTEEEVDIGPRQMLVCYPAPQQPISLQNPLRRRLHDPTFQTEPEETSYRLGRLIALDQLCQNQPAPNHINSIPM